MTVGELITLLKLYPQGMEVQMSMNYEYQCVVEPHFLQTETHGKTYVLINNWAEKAKN